MNLSPKDVQNANLSIKDNRIVGVATNCPSKVLFGQFAFSRKVLANKQQFSFKDSDRVFNVRSTNDYEKLRARYVAKQDVSQWEVVPEQVLEQQKLQKAIEHDVMVATRYRAKYKDAMQRNIPFEFTLAEFKALFRRTKCYYTGVDLSLQLIHEGEQPWNHVTIERMDPTLGYTKSNCVLVARDINRWKSRFEGSDSPLTMEHLKHFGKVITQMTRDKKI